MTTRRIAGDAAERPYVTGAEMTSLPVEEEPPDARPGDEKAEDEQDLAHADAPEAEPKGAPVEERVPDPESSGPPPWAKVPRGMRFPRGVRPIFVLFRAEWTRAPHKGDRQAILWELTDSEEFAAAQRGAGIPAKGLHEFAKGTIRAIDGHAADWSGLEGPASVDAFWTEIGPKCRNLVISIYQQTHAMNLRERADFFMNCIAARSVA